MSRTREEQDARHLIVGTTRTASAVERIADVMEADLAERRLERLAQESHYDQDQFRAWQQVRDQAHQRILDRGKR